MNNQDIGIELIQQYLQVQNTDQERIPTIYVPYLYLNEDDVPETRPDIKVINFIKSTTHTYAVPNTAYPVIYHGLKLKDTTDLNILTEDNTDHNINDLYITSDDIDNNANSQKLEIIINIPYVNGNNIGIHEYPLNYILENILDVELENMLALISNRDIVNIYTGMIGPDVDNHVVDMLNEIEPYIYIRNSKNNNYIILDNNNTTFLASLVEHYVEPPTSIELGGKPKRKQIKKRKQKTHKKRKKALKNIL